LKEFILISKVIMPDLGATGSDVTLMRWLVEPGKKVRAGQPLFLVETDKATVEVEAFREGFVRRIMVEAGDTVSLGSLVALIADSMDEPLAEDPAAEPDLKPENRPVDRQVEVTVRVDKRILISPLARRMAQIEGISLVTLRGTGRQGQILKRDIEKLVAPARLKAKLPAGARSEPVTPMQQAIARRTSQSKMEAPHFYANITVDVTAALVTRREAVEWAREKGWAPPTFTDLCLRAVALTLCDFPTLNASFQKDRILYYESINIGLVVGLEAGGMLVPVVRDAEKPNLFTLAAITRRLKKRAEKNTLSDGDMSGGTFTLSNLGMYGLDSFTAVINPPQAGILALGAVRERPWVVDGAVVPRPLMKATLSVDHRLVDGLVAARFLVAWKETLEKPSRLTLEPPEEFNR
jgi:pyruvate dehydrogenase E2 component (dihydrolipoamide acetyltransferase)